MVNSSLTYEILMYLNSFYFGMFATVELGMGMLKYINLTLAENADIREGSILLAVCILEFIRVHLGNKGSLSENAYKVWLSVILILPVMFGVVYILITQDHTLKLEVIICGLQLVLLSTELVFAVIFISSTCKTPTYD